MNDLEGVVAARFKDPQEARRARARGALGEWRGEALERAEGPDLPQAELAALERAGWVLMRASARSLESAEAAPCRPSEIGRVYRAETGELLINTGRLTVRLREDLTEEQARAALDRHNLTIKRRLAFSPNLFEVESLGPRSAIEAANAADADEDYHYAEPQMIRELGHR